MLAGANVGAPTGMDALQPFSDLANNWMSQRYATRMYNRTRSDNIQFWNMQNQYNSPAAQMQRFRDAGLNPNLIYGQGNSGNAGAIPTPDVQPVNFREPKFPRNDNASALLLSADLRIKNAQASNLEVQNDVIRQDAVLRRWQAERAGFDLGFETEMRDVSADARRESLRKTKLENDVLINRDAREAAMNSSNLVEAAHRMLTMIEQRKGMPLERGRVRADTDRIRKQIFLMEKDGTLKDMDIALRRDGINPSDPLWARYVGMFLSDIYNGEVNAGSIGKGIWSWLIKPGTYDYPDLRK